MLHNYIVCYGGADLVWNFSSLHGDVPDNHRFPKVRVVGTDLRLKCICECQSELDPPPYQSSVSSFYGILSESHRTFSSRFTAILHNTVFHFSQSRGFTT